MNLKTHFGLPLLVPNRLEKTSLRVVFIKSEGPPYSVSWDGKIVFSSVSFTLFLTYKDTKLFGNKCFCPSPRLNQVTDIKRLVSLSTDHTMTKQFIYFKLNWQRDS